MTQRTAGIAGSVIAAIPLIATASDAKAHAFAQRYDLPLPLWLYLLGAGAAVTLSFVIAASFLRGAAAPSPWRIVLPASLTRIVATVVPVLAVAFFILLLAAGFFGAQRDWDSNLLPVTVWILWWVGLTFVSALIGNVWSLLDPWRTLARWTSHWFASRASAAQRRKLSGWTWPERLGVWPAVALFFAFAWTELVWPSNAIPASLATAVALYSLLVWGGMALFGIEAWRRHADPFAQFFGLFARFAPFAVETDKAGRAILIVRPFGAGLAQTALPSPSATAFVILVLATVGFDGISETPLWETIVGEVMALFYAAGLVHALGYVNAGAVIKTLGLLATPFVFAAVYLATCAIVGRITGESVGTAARRYVLTLVPIAVAYHLAHYLSYLLIQGQAFLPLASDPLNLGWNLFGTREYVIDIAVVGARFVWISAVTAIVVGHVAAVVLAHAAALRANPDRGLALRGQLPMLVLMVGYTTLSLWILSQPIVEV